MACYQQHACGSSMWQVLVGFGGNRARDVYRMPPSHQPQCICRIDTHPSTAEVTAQESTS